MVIIWAANHIGWKRLSPHLVGKKIICQSGRLSRRGVTLQLEPVARLSFATKKDSLFVRPNVSSSISAIIVVGLCSLIATASATETQAEDAATTIVLVRHAEKPEDGLGQLNCQGLNRALALAPVIAKSFGRPDAIYAPNPSHQKEDAGKPYDYIRPLATIEPADGRHLQPAQT
jgi:hypothetical protein